MGLKRGGVHKTKHKEAEKASNLLTPVQVPLKTSLGALSRHNIFFSFNIGRHCVSTGITLKKKIRHAFCSYGTHSVWGNMHIIRQSEHYVCSTKTGTKQRVSVGAGYLKVTSKWWQGAYVRISQVKKMRLFQHQERT